MVRPSKAPERSRPKKALANLDLGWAQNAVCGLLFKRTLGFQAPQEVFRRLGKILNKALKSYFSGSSLEKNPTSKLKGYCWS